MSPLAVASFNAARWLSIGIGSLLLVASLIGLLLKLTVKSDGGKRTVANLNARIAAWWIMAGVFAIGIRYDLLGTCILFGFISFFALREMLTLAPTRRGDHHTMFWA